MPPPGAARAGEGPQSIDFEAEYPDLSPPTHLKWARSAARGIASVYGFGRGSQEEKELEQLAYLTMVRLRPRFDLSRVPEGGDPQGQFRGWVHPFIRGECAREALRLRNGGTFKTRQARRKGVKLAPVVVEALPYRRGPDGHEEMDVHDTRRPAAPESATGAKDGRLAALLLSRLTPLEAAALCARFGIAPFEETTRAQLREHFGGLYTVRQIVEVERKALAWLRAEFETGEPGEVSIPHVFRAAGRRAGRAHDHPDLLRDETAADLLEHLLDEAA